MPRRRLQSLYERFPISAQELFIAVAGWQSYRTRFGIPFRRALKELQGTDRLDADAVREDQERRLRETIRWAVTTVPYYRSLFRANGIDPESIRGLDDLPRIPVLEKKIVRHRARDLRSEAIPDRNVVAISSSGTTGTALLFYLTREALGWEYGAIWRQRGWFGFRAGEKFAGFGGQAIVPFQQQSPPFWRYDWARRRMLFSLYHMTPENLEHYAAELCRPGYRFWQGYPSSIGLISRFLLDHEIALNQSAPAAVFTSSETLFEFHRERIARATGAVVADRYGNAECNVSVPQCPDGSYHVDTEFGVLEIDPHDETEDWVRGEVIATGFANRAMPLLRYRTGDVATLRKGASCSCGRARPVLEQIDGRIEDYVVTPDGRFIGRMDHVFKNTHEISEAQIYQPSADRLIVRLVPGSGWGLEAERHLDHELRSRVGAGMSISYELHDALPREANGKFRAVLSAVRKAQLA